MAGCRCGERVLPSSRRIHVRSVQQIPAEAKGTAVNWTTVAGSLATCVITIALTPAATAPAAHAKNGDTHVIGEGLEQTVFYHNGAPILWDRGRELGMTNRLQQVPG